MKRVDPPRWNQKARPTGLMWELTVDDMKAAWGPPSGASQDQDESGVALIVANTFLEDAPHILRAQDIVIPSPARDQERALSCLLWLSKKVVPMWLPSWIDRAEPFKTRDMKEELEVLERDETTNLESIGRALMALRWLIPEADKVHRRSMHKAQRMGLRAAYRGALQHEDTQAHMLALLAANLTVFCVPDVDTYKGSLLLVESTQSSALMLLDNLLEEESNA